MSYAIFDELITDRSQAHVNNLMALRSRDWDKMTPSEQAQWYGEVAKGAYNYTDLNRVETAVATLAGIFGLNLVTKTDWMVWDKPTQTDMKRYLRNVVKIREKCSSARNFPTLPNSMDGLNYTGANNIELVLLRAYEFAEAHIQSGEIYSGEV